MSVSPHDLPDTASRRDADPETIPLGPQAAIVQRDIADSFLDITGVEETIVQQSNPRTRGPIEVVLLGDPEETETNGAIRTTVQGNISTFLPDGYVGDVQKTTTGYDEAVPVDADIIGSVLVWRHPLIPHITPVIADHGLVYDFDIQWPETASSLALTPAMTKWGDLEALYISLSAPVDQLDVIMDELMERVISKVPRPSITTVNAYTPEDDDWEDTNKLPDNIRDDGGNHVLEFSFADRELMHDPASGVYNLPAEDLSEVIEYATEERPVEPTVRNADHDQHDLTEDGIQLTITSPPYVDAIDYEAYANGNGDDWSRKHGVMVDNADNSTSEDELVELWKDQQQEIFEQVYEATRDGGYCAVVIGHIKLGDENWVPLPHEFSSVMKEIGWEFHERIIWRKIGARASRFGTTIQHPHPTYYYPNQIHEEIMVWRKGDIERRKDPIEELEISEVMKREVANNVWNIPTVPHNKGVNHPCPFPEEIVHRLAILYSYPGDIVVDPMVGSGTTVKIADRLGRVGIGTELQPAFVSEARRRLGSEEYTRASQIIPSFKEAKIEGDSPDAALRTIDVESPVEDSCCGHCTPVREIATDGHGNPTEPITNSRSSSVDVTTQPEDEDNDQTALTKFQ